MEVKLLTYTPDPVTKIYKACKICYSQNKIDENTSRKEMENLISKVIKSGHLSVTEHVSFTFEIRGISRVCSHQLVRHRIASYSQQSMRYTKPEDYIIPETIKKDERFFGKFKKIVEECFSLYEEMIKEGIPKEDARFILPHAVKTNIIMTMNLRELIHASSLRLCNRAQWEIRELFEKIKERVREVDPFLSSFLKPRCEHLGYCPEEKSCGRYPQRR